MARRIRREAQPDDGAGAARARSRAARWAFLLAGGRPADWIGDRWWSRWDDRYGELYRGEGLSRRERDEQLADHYVAALNRLGPERFADMSPHVAGQLEKHLEVLGTRPAAMTPGGANAR